jgi:hypothetical protein
MLSAHGPPTVMDSNRMDARGSTIVFRLKDTVVTILRVALWFAQLSFVTGLRAHSYLPYFLFFFFLSFHMRVDFSGELM